MYQAIAILILFWLCAGLIGFVLMDGDYLSPAPFVFICCLLLGPLALLGAL